MAASRAAWAPLNLNRYALSGKCPTLIWYIQLAPFLESFGSLISFKNLLEGRESMRLILSARGGDVAGIPNIHTAVKVKAGSERYL